MTTEKLTNPNLLFANDKFNTLCGGVPLDYGFISIRSTTELKEVRKEVAQTLWESIYKNIVEGRCVGLTRYLDEDTDTPTAVNMRAVYKGQTGQALEPFFPFDDSIHYSSPELYDIPYAVKILDFTKDIVKSYHQFKKEMLDVNDFIKKHGTYVLVDYNYDQIQSPSFGMYTKQDVPIHFEFLPSLTIDVEYGKDPEGNEKVVLTTKRLKHVLTSVSPVYLDIQTA